VESTSIKIKKASPHRKGVEEVEPGGQKYPFEHNPLQVDLFSPLWLPKYPPGHCLAIPLLHHHPASHRSCPVRVLFSEASRGYAGSHPVEKYPSSTAKGKLLPSGQKNAGSPQGTGLGDPASQKKPFGQVKHKPSPLLGLKVPELQGTGIPAGQTKPGGQAT